LCSFGRNDFRKKERKRSNKLEGEIDVVSFEGFKCDFILGREVCESLGLNYQCDILKKLLIDKKVRLQKCPYCYRLYKD